VHVIGDRLATRPEAPPIENVSGTAHEEAVNQSLQQIMAGDDMPAADHEAAQPAPAMRVPEQPPEATSAPLKTDAPEQAVPESAPVQSAASHAGELPSDVQEIEAAPPPDAAPDDSALTAPPTPEAPEHLSAQVDALLGNQKRGVLISSLADSRSKTRLNVNARKGQLVRRDVPQGTLFVKPDDPGLPALDSALESGDHQAIRQAVGEMSLGVSPEVASLHPGEMDRVVQTRNENGSIISQVGANAATEQAAAEQTKAQGASQETVPIRQALRDRQAPIAAPIDLAAHEAATSPHNDLPEPTDPMTKAGNYRKGHARIAGLDITIENPQGSIRSGTDSSGKPWAVEMKSHYGYLKRTVGADHENVDVFVKPGTPEDYNGPVFVVDQKKPGNGHFDEHKLLMGWKTEDGAKLGYRQNYTPNWKVGPITKMTVPELKAWIKSGDTTKPAAHAGLSAERLRSYLETKMKPEAVRSLLDSGKFKIAASSDPSLPVAIRAAMDSGRRVFGHFDEDTGTSYLIHDHLNDAGKKVGRLEDAYGIFLHEVGVHYGMREMLGKTFDDIVKTVAIAAFNGSKGALGEAARKAYGRLSTKTPIEHQDEEALAWMIADRANHKLGPVRWAIAKIQAFLLKRGIYKAASPDALVELARGAAMRAAGEHTHYAEHPEAGAIRGEPSAPEKAEMPQSVEALAADALTRDAHRWEDVQDTPSGPIFMGPDVSLFPAGNKLSGVEYINGERGYTVLDSDTGQRLGVVVATVDGHKITDIHWIESETKGMGDRTIRSIMANSDHSVGVTSIIDPAREFWNKVGAHDHDEEHNAKLTWDAYTEAKRLRAGGQGDARAADPTREPSHDRSGKEEESGQENSQSIEQTPNGEGGQENAGTANMTPGATYHGFISSTAPRVPQAPPMPGLLGKLFPSRPRVAKPIRREDIIRPFLKALNTRLYEGRVKGKGVMGFYRHPKGEVRVKRKADLETTAHEIAHLIDDRVFNGFRTDKTRAITRPWTSGPSHQVYATELKGLSLDKNKVHEGFAEFVRHWMTSPDIARKEAPQFTAWWENFVDTNKIGPALRDTQRGMAAWFDQDNATKLASKIGEPPPVNADLDTIFDEARQSVFDDLHGVYRMERDLKGDILPGGAYETARLTRGAHSVVEGAMTIGAPEAQADGSVRFVGKSLRAILDPVANDLDNFGVYAVARSARELMAQGRENLFTAGEIKAGLALETPEFRKAFSDYQDWNKKIVDFAEAKGLINPQTRKLWRRTEYLPFYRSGQRGATKNAGGMLGHSNPIKQLRGGTANLKSVLGNMIHNASTLITESLKNEARDEIAKLADTVAGGGKFMVRIGTDTKSMSVSKEQVRDFVAEMLGVKRDELRGSGGLSTVPPDLQVAVDKLTNEFMQQPDYLKFWMFKQAPKGDNLVAVMRDGKPQFYEVADPVLYRSMQALTRPARHWLVQFLNTFRMVGQTAVTLTPDFVLKNIARDTIMGGIMSRSGFRPIVDSLIGMKSRIKKDENYREYIANGGGFSSLLAQEDAFAKHLEKFYSKRGISYKTVLDSPTKLLHFIEEAANAFESSTRLGEYKRAREGGADPRHAAFAAREVSTDFAMRGDSHVAGFFYDTVPFLKAAANSMDRLYRGLAHDENRAHIAAKAGLLALASMALYNINRGNPLYEQLEDWDRDSNWHFFLPKSGVPDNAAPAERYTHYRFPKLWEIGAVSSLAERSLQHIMDQNAKGFGDEAGKIVSNVFGVDYVPQLLSPLYENELNKNRFTGRPIETQGMEELQPWARVGPYTSRSLAALGEKTRNLPEALQVNPVRTEALLRGYLKTWAQYGLSLVDGALFDDKPDMRADEYPVLRSFYEQEPAKHTKYETQFYDALKEATQLRRTMRHMNQTDRPEIADDLSAKDDGSYGILHGTQRSLEGITRDMREVYRSKTMLPKQKRKELDALIGERNSLLKDTMSDVKDAQGQAAVQ
jgi:hypothetical protein